MASGTLPALAETILARAKRPKLAGGGVAGGRLGAQMTTWTPLVYTSGVRPVASSTIPTSFRASQGWPAAKERLSAPSGSQQPGRRPGGTRRYR